MQRVQPACDLSGERNDLPELERSRTPERALVEGHDEADRVVGLDDVEDRDEMARLDRAGDLRLAQKARPRDRILGALRSQHLRGDTPALWRAGGVDLARRAGADQLLQPVALDHRAIIPGAR